MALALQFALRVDRALVAGQPETPVEVGQIGLWCDDIEQAAKQQDAGCGGGDGDALSGAAGGAEAAQANIGRAPVDLFGHQGEHHGAEVGDQIEQHRPVGADVGSGEDHHDRRYQQPEMKLPARGSHAIERRLQDAEHVHASAREAEHPQEDDHAQQSAEDEHDLLPAFAARIGLSFLSPAHQNRPGEYHDPENHLDLERPVLDVDVGIAGHGQRQRGKEPDIGGGVGQCGIH